LHIKPHCNSNKFINYYTLKQTHHKHISVQNQPKHPSIRPQFNLEMIKNKNPLHLRKRLNNGIKYEPGLPLIVLLHRELPTRIVVRMGHHKHLQLLRVPLVPLVAHPPPLFPRPTIDIQELNPVVQFLRRDIHRGAQNGVVQGVGFSVNGFPGLREPRGPGLEVGRDGSGHAVAEHDDEEEE
jgi:hypothetical protein